ncbi:MAG: hypothetical protein K2L27_07605 [Muribaculaceae bacterium]|nr:hypothetical protein [Muribaculaceae bacterium]
MPRLATLLLLWLACMLPATAAAPHPLEGAWRIISTGAEIEIRRSATDPDGFDITLLSSHDMSMPEGMHIGTATRTATPGRYVAAMRTQPSSPLHRTRRMVLTLRPDGALSFEPYTKGRTINLWRWIPYLFRVTVEKGYKAPSDIEGALRTDHRDLTRHRTL